MALSPETPTPVPNFEDFFDEEDESRQQVRAMQNRLRSTDPDAMDEETLNHLLDHG